jgi:hypothetical protein
MEETLMMLPFVASRCGSAAWVARTVAITSTESPCAQCSSVSWEPKPEALFTSTSIPPSARAASAT